MSRPVYWLMVCAAQMGVVASVSCGGSLSPGDGGDAVSTGQGSATGTMDGGACVAICGMVTGVVPAERVSCTFPLPCSEPLAFTSLVVFVDGQQTPRDDTRTEGWEYVDSTRSALALYGTACTAVMTNNVPVDVDYLCELAAPYSSRLTIDASLVVAP